MNAFLERHQAEIQGVLHCFDRVILRGHLPMAAPGYFSTWLYSKKISLNVPRLCAAGWRAYKDVVPELSAQLKAHAQASAEKAGRPYKHLTTSQPMEQQARAMAQKEGITEGLVCIYSEAPSKPYRLVNELVCELHARVFRKEGLAHADARAFPLTGAIRRGVQDG